MGVEGFGDGLAWAVGWQVLISSFSLYCWENSLLSNASSNTIEACNSGTHQQRRANRAVGWMRPSTPSKTASPS